MEQIVDTILENGGNVVEIEGSNRRIDYGVVSVEGKGEIASSTIHCITHVFLEDCLEQEVSQII